MRVPAWVDSEIITIRGAGATPHYTNGYLSIAEPPLNQMLSLEFPLPMEEIILAHRSRQIRTRLRGDQVGAMENFGADMTFFESLD